MTNKHVKINTTHLCRRAFLYIRQSTIRQVKENCESKDRQYGLRQQAIHLGWPDRQVTVIDDDQGQSAAPGSKRDGFKRLVAEVGLGLAGIVMGLEVSRLARNCSEWHKLLEICALTQTLIMDEDGLYDPAHFNDRLLLGLKGTMSEAELHVIRARLRGGLLNKAKRGELVYRLPVGFVRDTTGKVVFDPDQQVQETIRLFFKTFGQQGSAQASVRHFRVQNIKFPNRLHTGPDKGMLVWGSLTTGRALSILHNPWYAGAYAYGRRQVKKDAGGRIQSMPQESWHSFIQNAHEGYITWKNYEEIQKQLSANSIYPARKSPPREGPALLQGIVLCGRCGNRMTPRYHNNNSGPTHHYYCRGAGNTQALPNCQVIPAERIDKTVADVLLEVISPATIEVAFAVQAELRQRIEEIDSVHRKQIERAKYEMDLARRRYMEVDPSNRLVAGTLEAEWNEKMEILKKVQEDYEKRRRKDLLELDGKARKKIITLTQDFEQLWNNPQTPVREKKRLMRLLIEDVTLFKSDGIQIDIRFKGGAVRSLSIKCCQGGWENWKTPDAIIEEIDRLLDDHTFGEIATILNNRGTTTAIGKEYTGRRISLIQRYYGLRSRFSRLRQTGLLTLDEITDRLGITKRRVRYLRGKGRLPVGYKKLSDVGDCMYEPPAPEIKRQKAKIDTKDIGGAI